MPSWEDVRRHGGLVEFQAVWEIGACRANDPGGPRQLFQRAQKLSESRGDPQKGSEQWPIVTRLEL